VKSSSLARPWVRTLAAPYLRGYRSASQRTGSLRGFWFVHPSSVLAKAAKKRVAGDFAFESAVGFFVGYLVAEEGFQSLKPAPPECLVFAFAAPVGGDLHRTLVTERGSLVRRTFDYIRLLTHRPPRFVFQENQIAAMLRHHSMRDWSPHDCDHLSRNFFIETLAWLVRSALVRKFLEESPLSHAHDAEAGGKEKQKIRRFAAF
jgi:hypothetical protein